MDLQRIVNAKEWYRNQIVNKKLQLERLRERNKQIVALTAKKAKIDRLNSELETYLSDLAFFSCAANEENLAFRKRRLDYLNDLISERLKEFFPEDGFQSEVIYTTKYGKSKVDLRLIDSCGYRRKPSISEGKLCQYLISFAAIDGVVRSLGKNSIFIDEAFGVSSESNLPKLGTMLERSCATGMKLLIISQRSDLYSNVKHREIHLSRDVIENKVCLDSIEDYF